MERTHQHLQTCYWDVFNARWQCDTSAGASQAPLAQQAQQAELPEQREAGTGEAAFAG